jgi:hypothetical protein
MFFIFNPWRFKIRSLGFEVSALKSNGVLFSKMLASFLLKNKSIFLTFDIIHKLKIFKLNHNPINDNQSL